MARIGHEQVSATDLRAFAPRIPISLLASGTDRSPQQQYLRALIVRRLLSHEVTRRGIDTTQVVRSRAEERFTSRLSDIYRREYLWPGTEIDDALALAYFDSVGLHHQRLLAGIVVADRHTADRVRARLLEGASFEQLAREYSKHKPSARRGGQLGFLTGPQAVRMGIVSQIYDSLADSAISPVLPRGSDFQIIRFLESRSLPAEEFLPRIHDLLVQQQRRTRETDKLRQLAKELHWQVASAGLEVIAQRGGGDVSIQPWQFDAQEAATALFTYADKHVSIGQFLDLLARRRRTLTDTTTVATLGDELLRTELLLAEAARRVGIAAREENITWKADLLQELAIAQMRRQLLAAQARLSRDDVHNYYRQYPDLFRDSDDILIVEALLATEAEALAVLSRVEGGESLLNVAQRASIRDQGPVDARGTLRLSEHERMTNSILYAAVQQAPLDQVAGPVAVQGGYSVFQVIYREQGALIPFADVEARAGALARKHYQNEVFENFVEQLLVDHDDEIHIYPQELSLALPDSLIDRLVENSRVRAGLLAERLVANRDRSGTE